MTEVTSSSTTFHPLQTLRVSISPFQTSAILSIVSAQPALKYHHQVNYTLTVVQYYLSMLFIHAADVQVSSITMTEATITWNIPEFIEQEEYTVEYGLSPSNLNLESETVQSITDTSVNFEQYSVTIRNLTGGTAYYFRVVARFGTGGVYVRHTEVFAFFTQFERKQKHDVFALLQFSVHFSSPN